MEKAENKFRPWLKKLVSVFNPEPQTPKPPEQIPPAEFTQQTDSVIEPKESSAILPLTDQSVFAPKLLENKKADSAVERTRKSGPTQFQRHQLRQAQVEAEARERRQAKTKKKREATINKKITERNRNLLIRKHLDALRIKKMQCRNTWGRLDADQWKSVQNDFIRTVLRASSESWSHWRKEINRIVGAANIKKITTPTTIIGTTFEIEIAARLKNLGWSIQFLGKSGDQGGDILAQKTDKTIVIQCKNFGAKAGNGAVQEVIAATRFYHATAAAVVARNGFTKQAHALADKASVLLLFPDQLNLLDNFC